MDAVKIFPFLVMIALILELHRVASNTALDVVTIFEQGEIGERLQV
jgi:hypothetical protein